MAVVSDINPTFPFFVEEARDIVVSGAGTADISLELRRSMHLEADAVVALTPHNGTVTIPLKEILRGIPASDIQSQGAVSFRLSLVSIRLLQSGSEIHNRSYQVLNGARDFANPDYNDSSDFLKANILTTGYERTISTKTDLYFSGVAVDTRDWEEAAGDTLNLILYSDVSFRSGHGGSVHDAIIFFPLSEHPEPGLAESYCKRVTFSDIYTKLAAQGYLDPEIFGISFWIAAFYDTSEGSAWETSVVGFTVINLPINRAEFLFRNVYGVPDFIEARGSVSPASGFERETFVNGGVEKIVSNDTRRKFSVNTGRLFDRREAVLWQEFFESDSHYIFDDRGHARRIIIDEVKTNMVLKGNSTASFVFHFADKFNDKFITI